MVMWLYTELHKIKASEARELPKNKACLVCGGFLRRVAERMETFPYQWVPNGWICIKCNAMHMGVM